MSEHINNKRIPWHLIIVFLVLSVFIWTGGYLYYQSQKKEIKKEKLEDLSAIA